jgi:hypothetical protein
MLALCYSNVRWMVEGIIIVVNLIFPMWPTLITPHDDY